jgi:hypothetical protein
LIGDAEIAEVTQRTRRFLLMGPNCKLHEGFGNQGVMGEAVGLIGRRMSLERIRTMRSIGPEGVAGRTPGIKSIAVAMV